MVLRGVTDKDAHLTVYACQMLCPEILEKEFYILSL
jgi:hypothetical protein